MSYVFSHAFIPLAILFIFSKNLSLNPRYIIYLSIFGIFPDFDAIFHHRYTFHNIFILIIPILAFIFINRQIFGMVTFYLYSHLVLDTFNGGIAVLYPFTEKILFINTEILQTYDLKTITFVSNYGFTDNMLKTITENSNYGVVSSENFGIIVLFMTMFLIYAIFVFRKKS